MSFRTTARLCLVGFAVLLLAARGVRADSPSGITVSGSGQSKSKPTEVEIGALVSGEAELTNDAMVKYRDAKKRALAAIEGLKLPNVTIESMGVSVSQAVDPNQAQMMMQGRAATMGKPKVQASESMKIVLKGVDKSSTDALMDQIMKLIDTGRDAGLQIGPPTPMNYYQYQMMMQNGQGQGMLQFKISDPAAAREQAYKLAMDEAKAKAQRLADLAGVKLGKIISVQDAGQQAVQPNPYMYYGGQQPTDPTELTSTMLGDIALKVTLTVQFEIAK